MRTLLTQQDDEKPVNTKFTFSSFHYFDSHTHFFPQKLFRTLWRYFDANYWPIHRKDTPENLAQALTSEYNVEHFLILNYAHKKGIAQSMNNWTNEFCMAPKRKGVAIPFGILVKPELIVISSIFLRCGRNLFSFIVVIVLNENLLL